jgi:pimeloyl-ACP methyl ester carboxylesterase
VLLWRHGPDAGLLRFTGTEEYRRVLHDSPAAAKSMRDQFTSPSAVARAVRLDRMPRCVPFGDRADLRSVTVPTLVLGAHRDPVHPLAMARAWATELPSARLVELVARDVDAAGQAAQVRAAMSDLAGWR